MAAPRKDDLIAGRYRLVDQLGAGGMGEVWTALDTRFESRIVAVKILKEDESIAEDARSRQQFLRRVHEAGAGLTTPIVGDAIEEFIYGIPGEQALRDRIETLKGDGPLDQEAAARIFDAIVDDPVFNDNARARAKVRKLFRDEANSVATLRHENIVGISDYGDDRGMPYLVMEYIEGQVLSRVIQRGTPLSLVQRLRLMEDLCAGLGYAHQKKLVHRDIKPANLIIDANSGRLKILDFGVVRRLEHAGQSTVGVALGTLCYMSPEQVTGSPSVDQRSDIFSVGGVFYELLSGQRPFPAGDSAVELAIRIQTASPTPLTQLVPGIDPAICEIIDRALSKSPNQRYQNLVSMQKDIERVRARLERDDPKSVVATVILPDEETRPGLPSTATAPPAAAPQPVTPAPARRSFQLPAAAAAIAVTALGGYLYYASLGNGSGGPLPALSSTSTTTSVAPAATTSIAATSSVTGGIAQPVVMQSLVVDVLPWARVKVVSLSGSDNPAPNTLTTPFTIRLPIGDYRLECENGGVSQPFSFPVRLEAAGPTLITRVMPGFDVNQVVQMLLGDRP